MRFLLGFLVLLALHLSPAASYSDQYCANLTRSAAEAFRNSNWRVLLDVSKDYENECRGVGGIDSIDYLANAIGNQAEALFWLSRFNEALSAADRCLASHGLPHCHLGKGRALVGLGRVEEAKLALQEAKRSASSLVATADLQVKFAPTEGTRELWSARRLSYRAHSDLADDILAMIDQRGKDRPPQGQVTTGSGIAISEDGSVLTNHHVTQGCVSIQVNTVAGPLQANLKASDPKADLALLVTRAKFSSYASIRSTPPQIGEAIAVIGFPLPGLLSPEGSVQFGHISSLQGIGGDVQRMQISAAVQKGNSGGPVIDKDGLLLGVVVEKLNALEVARITGDIPQNIGFAIRPEVVQSFLRLQGVAVGTPSPSTDLSSTDLAKVGRELTVLVTCKR